MGGVIEKDMPHLPGKVNFRGCMENVFINGINIIYKTKYQDPDVRLAPKKVLFSISTDIRLCLSLRADKIQ